MYYPMLKLNKCYVMLCYELANYIKNLQTDFRKDEIRLKADAVRFEEYAHEFSLKGIFTSHPINMYNMEYKGEDRFGIYYTYQ